MISTQALREFCWGVALSAESASFFWIDKTYFTKPVFQQSCSLILSSHSHKYEWKDANKKTITKVMLLLLQTGWQRLYHWFDQNNRHFGGSGHRLNPWRMLIPQQVTTHHHTDTSTCLGHGSQPVWQVESDRAAHHRCVSREAVNELARPVLVKKRHFLSEDGGEDRGTQITDNPPTWAGRTNEIRDEATRIVHPPVLFDLNHLSFHSPSMSHLRSPWGRLGQRWRPHHTETLQSAWCIMTSGRPPLSLCLLHLCRWCQSLSPGGTELTWSLHWRRSGSLRQLQWTKAEKSQQGKRCTWTTECQTNTNAWHIISYWRFQSHWVRHQEEGTEYLNTVLHLH